MSPFTPAVLHRLHRDLLFPLGCDPRWLVAVSAVGGTLQWTLSWPWAGLPCVAALTALLIVRCRVGQSRLRAGGGFMLFWILCKLTLDSLFSPLPLPAMLPAILADAGVLAVRLAGTLALGLALTATTTPLGLGLTMAWLLRPLLGQHAWKPALALMVMTMLLPRCATVLRETWATTERRCPVLSARARLPLFAAAALHRLDRQTQTRAWALVLRNLTCTEVWTWPPHPPTPGTPDA